MKEMLKNQYKNVILCTSYILIAICAYTGYIIVKWDNILLGIIVGCAILVFGIVCMMLYIKGEYKKEITKDEQNK